MNISVIKKKSTYPKLMISREGDIVFFTKACEGSVIFTKDKKRYETADMWDMDSFVDYKADLTIKEL